MPARKLMYSEYRRRVFNKALLECFCNIHGQVLNGACQDDQMSSERLTRMAKNLCTNFYTDELKLNESTVSATRERLKSAVHFIQECGEVCEQIADDKAKDAQEEKLEIYDDQTIELSDEDKGVIEQLFDVKNPEPQIDAIRDATVNALLAEEKKSQEIRDAIDIAKSQVADGSNPKALEETSNRLGAIGPTSLMNAIMNNVTAQAVKEISESGNFSTLNKVMVENADEIKTRSAMVYSLYESVSVLGIRKFAPGEVKRIALSIYHEK